MVRPFHRKIAQSVYYLCIVIHSHDCANIDNKYVYTDPLAVI